MVLYHYTVDDKVEPIDLMEESPCYYCERCDCFLCDVMNPDVHLGEFDFFGEEIS